ncbi:large ribosomal subunit protein mL42 isoform X3 [Lethenteron reissneri]|uniref:large ribosomal subunit protein mL42 isoform X3 n=1 Tax=Lethenteron reissneri TaxID=7753 RepID=UPI002AB6C791|nr:large ribosomal subunit protein mL42 isoform X3 [Lethenteron reissneri]
MWRSGLQIERSASPQQEMNALARLAAVRSAARLPRLGWLHPCYKSSYSALPDDYNCKVELALTSDGRTIVCHHPALEFPYELSQPMPRPDPVNNTEETYEEMLKARLEVNPLTQLRKKPHHAIEELSRLFYTSKHRWFPVGQYHLRRIKKNPPKDRPDS